MVNDPTDLAIIEHLALHRVATRASIGRLIPSGATPDKRMRRLTAAQLVLVNKRLAGNRSLYQLTKKGAAQAGVPETRARALGAQAVLKHLGVLLFCEAKPAERFRVEDTELGPVLGGETPEGVHCVCGAGGKPLVAHCYVPGSKTPVVTVVRHLRRVLKSLNTNTRVADFIRDGRYGFAVVVESPARRKALMDAVRTPEREGGKPLSKAVRVWVEAVPELSLYLGAGSNKPASSASEQRESLFGEEDRDS